MQFVPRNPAADPEAVAELCRRLDIHKPLAAILAQRGLADPEEARAFLNPDLETLPDPMGLAGMEEAVELIRSAIEENELITVYGDYDADGVCATTILLTTLRAMGARCDYYLPSRSREGYGLHVSAMEELADSGTGLLITVDCGITAVEEVTAAQELGMMVVVTDHHLPAEKLPEADALIDPHLPGQDEACRVLCGAAVAGMLVWALAGKDAMLANLDLLALATVADIVPLTGASRILAAQGLMKIRREPRPGILALCQSAQIKHESLSAGQIAFSLAPRINASGRVDVADHALELLLADRLEEAAPVAEALEADNALRRQRTDNMAIQAAGLAESTLDLAMERGIVLWQEDWDAGVLGIVASRMVERFGRPCVLMTKSGEVYKGSARSIAGVNLYDTLKACTDVLAGFGGHAMAAGVTLLPENLEKFREKFSQVLAETCEPAVFLPRSAYDLAMEAEDLTLEAVKELELLAPTGMANPSPVVKLSAQRLDTVTKMGNQGQHFRCEVITESGPVPLVGFSCAPPEANRSQEILATPTVNVFNNTRRLQCRLEAFRYVSAPTVSPEQMQDSLLSSLTLDGPVPDIPVKLFPGACPWLKEPFGTLIIVRDPAHMPRLDDHVLILSQPQAVPNRQNALLIAPDDFALANRGGSWRRILFAGVEYDMDRAKILAQRLQSQAIGVIMDDSPRRPKWQWDGFGEALLRNCYKKLRDTESQRKALSRGADAFSQVCSCWGLSPVKSRVILHILMELSLAARQNEPPYISLLPPHKTELTQSETYRTLLKTLEEENE